MVWSRVSDGFKQTSITSDGLNSARLQEEEGTPESIMDINDTKGFGFVGCDMGGSYGSNKGSHGLEKMYCPMCFYSMRKD